jgi:DNA-binding MarR family transcriptional regulator
MSPIRNRSTLRRDEAVSPASLALAGELRVIMSRLGRRTRAVIGDLTASQLSALTGLEEAGPIRLHELAAREGVAAPTMSRVVDALEAAGFVERRRDPLDARSSFITVSDAGEHAIKRFIDSRTQLFGAHLDALPDADRAAIAAALPALKLLVDSFSALPDAKP